MNNDAGVLSREKLENAATWVGASVLSAFFSSLDRFSCINLSTADDSDEEADDASLMPTAPVSDASSAAPASEASSAALASGAASAAPAAEDASAASGADKMSPV